MKGGMCGERGGACMAGGAERGTHPTGMHSCSF